MYTDEYQIFRLSLMSVNGHACARKRTARWLSWFQYICYFYEYPELVTRISYEQKDILR